MAVYMILRVILSWYLYMLADGACTWPPAFLQSTWHDSARGDVTFNASTVTGWAITVEGTMLDSWRCLSTDTFDTDGNLMLLTTNTFTLFSVQYYAYMCIKMTEITASSYRYYQSHPVQSSAGNERIFVYPVNTLTDPNTICDETNGATGVEYQVLVKAGSEMASKVTCPYSFLGRHDYTYTTADGTVACDNDITLWDLCTDNTQMTFACDQVSYSASNTVWCVDSVYIDGTNAVTVYNGYDSATVIDDVNVFRFACFVIAEDGSIASVSPRYCKTGQNADTIPTDVSGLPAGALISITSTLLTCPSCPVLDDPPRGTVSVSTNGATTTAVYTCDSTYTLSGSPSRQCSDDDTWTLSQPACNCAEPPSPTNGAVTTNADGSVSTYTCEQGYSLDGLSTRNCVVATGTWEEVDPDCVLCETLIHPTGATVLLETSGITTSATVKCSAGFTLSGQTKTSCQPDGSWNPVLSTCVPCDPLSNPFSGFVEINTDGSVSTARYSCYSGYNIVGVAQVTCDTTGDWNQLAPPTCVCQAPAAPVDGAVTADGLTATYTCELGFTLSGDKIRTCQDDGSGWSSENPTCTRCQTLSVPNGGVISYSTDDTSTSATYTCTAWYTLDGAAKLTCHEDGIWNNVPPVCAKCDILNIPSSGTVLVSTSGTTSSASYTCYSGYNLIGATIRLCRTDGSWELSEPSCVCRPPADLADGSMTADGVTVEYACNLGYSLLGPDVRTCQDDGTGWSDADPSCSQCASLEEQAGVIITLTTDGINTGAIFECEIGYTLDGVTAITCDSSGQWDSMNTNCVPCPELSDPASGIVTTSTTGHVTSASFYCLPGYYISGPALLECRTDGTWDKAEPTCKCNFPNTPSNGQVSVSDTPSGSYANYECENGFTLDGIISRLCNSNATGWDGTDPTCVECEPLDIPSDGQFTLSTTGSQTSAKFLCDLGTTLSGETVLTCLHNGSWSVDVPVCVPCTQLDMSASGSVSSSTTGTVTRATLSCQTGYSPVGATVLTCLGNGSWDLPAAVCKCDIPPAPVDGYINVSSDAMTVYFGCSDGYDLIGSSVLICRDDGSEWNASQPICEPEVPPADESPIQMWAFITVAAILLLAIAMLVVMGCVYIRARNRLGRISTDIGDDMKNTIDVMDKEEVPRAPGSGMPSTSDEAVVITSEAPISARPSSLKRRNSGETDKSHVSKKSVRLPAPTPPPQAGKELIITERKRKNFNELQLAIDRKYPPRRLSPLDKKIREIGIDRVRTPDLLSYVPFNYIHPVFTHESPTPATSEAGSRLHSRATSRATSGQPSIRSKRTNSDLYDE